MKTKTYTKIKIPDLNVNKFKVVLIGVSKFTEDSQIENVPNIELNINVLKQIFSEKSFFNIPPDNILVLLNENKVSIEKQLSTFAKDTDPDDTLIVYFSGHGFVSTDDLSVYLSTVDSISSDIISTGISVQRLRDLVANSYAKRKIIILDACYSGAIHRTISDSSSYYINEKNKFEGEFIVSSSSEDEHSMYSDSNENEPTYFTKELLNVLTYGLDNNKPYLTLNEIFNEVRDALGEKNLPIPQKTVISSIGDMPFARNNKFEGNSDDFYKNIYVKNILNKINRSNTQLPSFKSSKNNFLLNIILSFAVVIAFSSIFIFTRVNNTALTAVKSSVKIEQTRKSISSNYIVTKQNNSDTNSERIEQLMKKVNTFLRADSGREAAISYLKKIIIIDPNYEKARTLLDSLTNDAD